MVEIMAKREKDVQIIYLPEITIPKLVLPNIPGLESTVRDLLTKQASHYKETERILHKRYQMLETQHHNLIAAHRQLTQEFMTSELLLEQLIDEPTRDLEHIAAILLSLENTYVPTDTTYIKNRAHALSQTLQLLDGDDMINHALHIGNRVVKQHPAVALIFYEASSKQAPTPNLACQAHLGLATARALLGQHQAQDVAYLIKHDPALQQSYNKTVLTQGVRRFKSPEGKILLGSYHLKQIVGILTDDEQGRLAHNPLVSYLHAKIEPKTPYQEWVQNQPNLLEEVIKRPALQATKLWGQALLEKNELTKTVLHIHQQYQKPHREEVSLDHVYQAVRDAAKQISDTTVRTHKLNKVRQGLFGETRQHLDLLDNLPHATHSQKIEIYRRLVQDSHGSKYIEQSPTLQREINHLKNKLENRIADETRRGLSTSAAYHQQQLDELSTK